MAREIFSRAVFLGFRAQGRCAGRFISIRMHKENGMGGLLDLIDTIMSVGDVYAKHGIKGCLLLTVGLVAFLGILFFVIYALAQ